jgi:hypothetical protein
MLDELRVTARAVVDHSMVVVAHRAREQHGDVAAQRGVDQAVPEGVGSTWRGSMRWRYQDLGQSIATRSPAVGAVSVRWSASVSETRTSEAMPMNLGANEPK